MGLEGNHELITEGNSRFNYFWDVVPLYSRGAEIWEKIYAYNNTLYQEPVEIDGKILWFPRYEIEIMFYPRFGKNKTYFKLNIEWDTQSPQL